MMEKLYEKLYELKNILPYSDYEALASMEAFQARFNRNENESYDKLIRNGNYWILMFEDGTKLRFTHEDKMIPEYPECIDISLSNKCNQGCEFCYADCRPDGGEAAPKFYKPYFDELMSSHPWVELAININDLSSPIMREFVDRYEKNFFINATINGEYLMKEQHNQDPSNIIWLWSRMSANTIRGLGISVPLIDDKFEEFLDALVHTNPGMKNRIVLHMIAGIHSTGKIRKYMDKGYNILILGYKQIGRGATYFAKISAAIGRMICRLRTVIKEWYDKHMITSSLAFDGLALEQLHIKDWMDPKVYDKLYSGGEGEFSFYFDLVNMKYSSSSIDPNKYDTFIDSMTIRDMFQDVRSKIGVNMHDQDEPDINDAAINDDYEKYHKLLNTFNPVDCDVDSIVYDKLVKYLLWQHERMHRMEKIIEDLRKERE